MKAVITYKYKQGWEFSTVWEGFGSCDASWELPSPFIFAGGTSNPILIDYLKCNSMMEVAMLAKRQATCKSKRAT